LNGGGKTISEKGFRNRQPRQKKEGTKLTKKEPSSKGKVKAFQQNNPKFIKRKGKRHLFPLEVEKGWPS